MRVTLVHNRYRQRGGEDAVVDRELGWLQAGGHDATLCVARNDPALGRSRLRQALTAWRAPFSRQAYRRVREHLRAHAAQVGHVHNWFPVFSPAVYDAHHDLGIPVVQTLHNYRLSCAAGTHLRGGRDCGDCSSRDRRAAVRHGCYRGSRLGSEVWRRTIEAGFASGRFAGVDAYVAPSQAVARAHVALGLPAERIHVIPHGCPDPWERAGPPPVDPASGCLFVGRLSDEKGVPVLLEACRGLPTPLRVVGTGPLADPLRALAQERSTVTFAGEVPPAEVPAQLAEAAVVVMPHTWREPFGLIAVEALAAGRPVIASRLGGPAEIVEDGVSGLLVPPGDPHALRAAIDGLLGDPDRLAAMSQAARARYEACYRPRVHVERLVGLFRRLTRLPVAAA